MVARIIKKFFSLLKKTLLRAGISIERPTSVKDLKELIGMLRPVNTKFELVRIGGDNDGGYLLPNDLDGVVACYSPGVGDTSSFEQDLFENYRIGSHLADYSVDGPKGNSLAFLSFTKKFLGCYNNSIYMTIDEWMAESKGVGDKGDLVLQMDIEGAEIETLFSISEESLKRFRIIALELHNIESWAHPGYFKLIRTLFEKLLQSFYVVHIHPNNSGGIANVSGIHLPRLVEITLLRKDRSDSLGYVDKLPHKLDRPNVPELKDTVMPKIWIN